MGLDDKIAGKIQETKGSFKEAVGDATDDRDLQAEGKLDQVKGAAKQAGENLKEAAQDAAAGVKKAFSKE